MLFRKLTISSLASVTGQAAVAISVFIVSPLLILGLGEEQYGLWLLCLSIAGYLELLDLGISGTTVRFLGSATSDESRHRFTSLFLFFRAFYRRTGAFIIAVGLSTAAVAFILSPENPWRNNLWLIAGLAGVIGLSFIFRIYAAVLRATLNYHLLNLPGIIRVTLYTVIILLFSESFTVFRLLALHAGLMLMEHLIIFSFARKRLSPLLALPGVRSGEYKAIASHAGKNIVSLVAEGLRYRTDIQIVGGFVSLGAVTQYGVGMRIPRLFLDVMIALFGSQFVAAFSRTHASGSTAAKREQLALTTQACTGVSLTIGATLFIITPSFIELWLGPGFDTAKTVSVVLIPSFAIFAAQFPLNCFLIAENKHGRMALLSLAGALLNIGLSIALVGRFGTVGVASATCVELALLAVSAPFIAAPFLGFPPLRYILDRIVIPGLAFVALLFVLDRAVSPSFLPLDSYGGIALTAAGVSVLGALVSWFVVLKSPTRAWILRKTNLA